MAAMQYSEALKIIEQRIKNEKISWVTAIDELAKLVDESRTMVLRTVGRRLQTYADLCNEEN